MKILILGSSGLLGLEIYKVLSNNFKVYHNGLKKRKINLEVKSKFFRLLNKIKPSLIVNCAAHTNIDYCEKNKSKIKKINSDLIKWIFEFEKRNQMKIWLIQISTDSMYYKKKRNSEKDKIKCSNYYVVSKIIAEQNCAKTSLILRTNFFGKSKNKNNYSFTDFVYNSFKSGKKFYLVDDVYFNPLRTITIARIIKKIIMNKQKISGVFNLGSIGKISKFNFALFFAKKLKISNRKFIKIKSKNLFKIKRSRFTVTSSKKIENKLNFKLPDLKSEIIKELKDNYA